MPILDKWAVNILIFYTTSLMTNGRICGIICSLYFKAWSLERSLSMRAIDLLITIEDLVCLDLDRELLEQVAYIVLPSCGECRQVS